eukprot:scaffold279275_cov19-Tisochrysis_lutea.AAC.1
MGTGTGGRPRRGSRERRGASARSMATSAINGTCAAKGDAIAPASMARSHHGAPLGGKRPQLGPDIDGPRTFYHFLVKGCEHWAPVQGLSQ